MLFRSTGTLNSTDYNTFSDLILKENIKPIENSLEILKQINPVQFNWKDSGKTSFGIIAQEIEAILPNLVDTNENGLKTVSYLQLIAFLIDAIKKQQEQIDELRK